MKKFGQMFSIVAVTGLVFLLAPAARAQTIFSEDFNGYAGTQNSTQSDTGKPVAHTGSVAGWSKSGSGTMHAVSNAPNDWAIMFFQDNVITLTNGIAANDSGTSYEVNFDYGTAVYNADGQKTLTGDGLLVEVLRTNDTVLASQSFLPGAWDDPSNHNLDGGRTGTLQYAGDGTGVVRLRIGPDGTLNSGRFEGEIDNLSVAIYTPAANAPIYSEDFDGYVGTVQAGAQLDTGLDVAHTGAVAGWDRSGGGTMHAVDFGGGNWAIMFFQDNVITLTNGIAANQAGVSYNVEFDYGTAVYSLSNQKTEPADSLLVEVLRTNDTVLASDTFAPGTWGAGNYNLDAGLHGTLQYVGDGSGVVRLRLGPTVDSSGNFEGEIDNLSVAPLPPPAGTIFIFE